MAFYQCRDLKSRGCRDEVKVDTAEKKKDNAIGSLGISDRESAMGSGLLRCRRPRLCLRVLRWWGVNNQS